jgi:DNA-binding NarL/FixJ family response regulator
MLRPHALRMGRQPNKRIRILIADREGVFRLGLKKVFALEDDLRVVAQAENAAQVVGLAEKFNPDLFFIQSEIANEEPGDLLRKLRKGTRPGRILITTGVALADEGMEFVKRGASGVVERSDDPGIFVKCARKVTQGEVWLSKGPTSASAAAAAAPATPPTPLRPADTLTRREKSIISCLMQGWRNREIAQKLAITEQTVKNHLRTIYDKVGVSDRLELVLYAIHHRLELPPPPAAAA